LALVLLALVGPTGANSQLPLLASASRTQQALASYATVTLHFSAISGPWRGYF
jgi:hypothetical protein